MIRRRDLLAATATSLAATSLAAPAARALLPVARGNYLRFRILREGRQIGTHDLSFAPEPHRLVVRIAIRIHLALGPLPLFRYRHDGVESWLDERFVGFHSRTEDNGRRLHTWVRRTGEGLVVQGSTQPRYIAPADALPTTYWNSAFLDGPMIDSQSGRLLHPHVHYAGTDEIWVAKGLRVAAEHYRLTGDLRLGIWYDPDRIWIGLAFKGSDGSRITYERL